MNRILSTSSYCKVISRRHILYGQQLLTKRGCTNSNEYAGRGSGGGGAGIRPPILSHSWSKIEWFYIPAGVGFALIGFLQLKHILKREQQKKSKASDVNNNDSIEERRFFFKTWQVELLRKIPTRALSRAWGFLADCYIPVWLRKPLMNSYGYMFNCKLHEAVVSDVTKYDTFNKYFTRKLRLGLRVVDKDVSMVSPADSTVLTFGCVDRPNLDLEQVKGFTYPLSTFVGPKHPFYANIKSTFSERGDFFKPGSCKTNEKDFKLFYCTLYLGPGDYHWFHSPTEWTVEHRRHVPGDLFSVNPLALRTINGIFNFNERVLLSGQWKHGSFLYGAIGAYNVGSIKLDFQMDKDLRTNRADQNEMFKDRLYSKGIHLNRGESMGRFELGSSLVLVFTAPKDFQFVVQPGQKLNYGQPLGVLSDGNK